AGYFSVFGGLIKGNCHFEFEIGQQCDIVPGGTQDILVIQSLSPADSTEGNSVFVRPQAIFNLPVGVATPLLDEFGPDDEVDEYVYLKPQLASFTVTETATGAVIPGTLEWDDLKTVAAFRPDDILPGNTEFRLDVKVQILQRREGEATFQLMDQGGNIPPEQEKSVVFTTGRAPNYIPEYNVRYAYPINLQTAFHKDESQRGYVQLDQGQDYLFAIDAAEWEQKIRWVQDGRVVSTSDYQYNTESNELSFNIPGGALSGGTVIYFEVIDLPVGPGAAVTANVDSLITDLDIGQVPDSNGTSVLLATQEANGTIEGNKPFQLYRLDFRTSQYPTFAAKAAALTEDFPFIDIQALTEPVSASGQDIPFLSIDDFGAVVGTDEGFDRYDLSGFYEGAKDIAPLMRAKANLDLTEGNWFNVHPNAQVYNNFPRPGAPFYFDLEWRPELPFELPPVRAVKVQQNSNAPLRFLSDFDISAGTYSPSTEPLQLRYHLPYVIYRDYADFWNQAMLYAGTPGVDIPDWLTQFTQWDFVYPNYGTYQIQLEYYYFLK
ncbi:MAG: hypothetical protein AAF597_13285, partial [Bacteroidota bacterium]